jgi:hypothetical protein
MQTSSATALPFTICLIPQNNRVFVGSYDFHFLKIGGVWKIDKFKFNLKFIEGNKGLEKFAE